MPGKKNIFDDLITKAHNAAWDQKWDDAVALYRRALAEFPEDTNGHVGLANALEQSEKYEDALHEFRMVAKLLPTDPTPLVRAGGIQEKLNRRSEAAGTYTQLGDLFVKLKQPGRAVKAWQRAAALEPERTEVHLRLADEYKAASHLPQAAKEYLTLARVLQKRGERDKALAYVEQAQDLDPSNPLVQKLYDELTGALTNEKTTVAGNPLGQAQRESLARLAESVLEDRTQRADWREAEALIVRAINAQSQKRYTEAIDLYQKVIAAGVRRVEVYFNLGLLYQEMQRYDEAIPLLEKTMSDSNYALASHLALGQAYRAKGEMDHAVNHLLEVMKIGDVAGTERDKADDILKLYQSLSVSAEQDAAQAEALSNRLIEFLGKQGWQDKVAEVRRHITSTNAQGATVTLAEVMEVQASEKVIEALELSRDYSKRGWHTAAISEAFEAISLAPNYVPAHVHLAEVLVHAGKREAAVTKYEMLIHAATVQGDKTRAQNFFRRLQQLTLDDPDARQRQAGLIAQLR